ncbi:vWA domain-containing protein [Sediminibacterium goheungense]|uniref:Ca-activated chloride channel family protein n=1 Tax=Sediminibacterium goheungense TaxID=1086393 RepID=A0A4R6ISU0_9BACT|nr:VWA domain-containing protein [Sediminibacterium goheungense]TDO23453.1 Ca-activated chloride channel family protein [Sediminibacterium goheungense]TDO25056.1 Ca-activated chloride channel family protein [Sediminibacterium goheungense]
MKYLMIAFLLLSVAVMGFTPAEIFIQGIVKDEKGMPVVAASVIETNTKNVSETNAEGKFRLKVNKEKTEITVMAIGFKEQKLKVTQSQIILVVLKADSKALTEVVVTAYAKQRKMDMTGSVVIPSSVHQYSASNISQQLQGTVAGVTVVKGNGKPFKDEWHDPKRRMHDHEKNFNREGYDAITENTFQSVTEQPLSTFSIDVDAASYSNLRRFIQNNQLPPAGAVRIEEMINYFSYQYPQPKENQPFSVNTEITDCPWNKKHQLMLVGLQGKQIDLTDLPASNLVFLIDVSGSMYAENKLPLVKASLKLLADQLRPKDKVSIVTYAGSVGLVLPATSGEYRTKIKEVIDRLEAGGATAGGAGIQLAYKVAREQYKEKGNNRVILCTDGDFNVGQTSDAALETMIEQERRSGIFLTVLGYGMGNYQDAKMQKLADKGNGNHAYIDGIAEAKKVLISEFGGTLYTIAKDVKLQIEFNPRHVKGYRLIGYENRMLAKEDFNNDQKDAGDMGSGHTVTAIYELVPPDAEIPAHVSVDPLKYQHKDSQKQPEKNYANTDERVTIKLRYKEPDGEQSKLITEVVKNAPVKFAQASNNLRFAAAVASFGLTLRGSAYKGSADFDQTLALAKSALGTDKEGYRREFIQLVEKAQQIALQKTQTNNGVFE